MEVRRLVPPHLFSLFLFFLVPRPAGPSLLSDPAPLPLPLGGAQSPGRAHVGTRARARRGTRAPTLPFRHSLVLALISPPPPFGYCE